MKGPLREAGHLFRLVGLLVAGVAIFVVVRGMVVPTGFGQYGHYRPGALQDVAARPIAYAGQADCALCHEEVANSRVGSRHEKVHCEACHGPLARHVDSPSDLKPKRPEMTALCVRCHEADAAKPKGFPQVVTKEHSGGEGCGTCHKPHHPKI
jgi:cytochrome c553